jgi:hypothetical protein
MTVLDARVLFAPITTVPSPEPLVNVPEPVIHPSSVKVPLDAASTVNVLFDEIFEFKVVIPEVELVMVPLPAPKVIDLALSGVTPCTSRIPPD